MRRTVLFFGLISGVLAVGLLITAVSGVCAAVGFEILYLKVAPDFGELFSASMVERVRASGGTPQQIE